MKLGIYLLLFIAILFLQNSLLAENGITSKSIVSENTVPGLNKDELEDGLGSAEDLDCQIRLDGKIFILDAIAYDESMKDRAMLLVQASAVPYFANANKPIGVRIYDIRPCGLFYFIGLQKGDVLTHINNNPIDGEVLLSKLVFPSEGLPRMKTIDLTVQRDQVVQHVIFEIR